MCFRTAENTGLNALITSQSVCASRAPNTWHAVVSIGAVAAV